MATTNKDLALPAYSSPGWNTPLNSNFSIIDAALGASQPINLTGFAGGNLLLTPTFPIVSSPITSASYFALRLGVSGVMTANTNIMVPTGVSGIWVIGNYTTGAFQLSLQGQGGGTYVVFPKSTETLVFCDGTNAVIVSPQPAAMQLPTVGDYKFNAGAYSGLAGWVLCDGRAISRATYSALFGIIGTSYGAGDGSTTFNVPDARGRVIPGADNMGTGSAGRLFNWGLGTVGGESTHALSAAENGTHNHGDFGHVHADSGHSHSIPGNIANSGGSGAALGVGWNFSPAGSTGVSSANIQAGYANISYSGSGSPHNNVQPTMTSYVFIYAGV